MVLTDTQINNFWSKVDKTDSCWNWTGYIAYGYGKVNINGLVYFAHRISALLHGKEIEPLKKEPGAAGKVVIHSCDNRKCVNPAHLSVGTQKDNMADAISKGRHFTPDWSGNKNPQSRFMRLNRCVTA